MKVLRFLGSLLVLFFFAGVVKAQPSSEKQYPLIYSLGLNSGVDYVANSVDDEVREIIPSSEKIYVHTSIPVNLKFRFSFTNPHVRNYFPGGYQGISLGVLNFGAAQSHGLSTSSRLIGYPVTAYVFQGAPFWHNSRGLSISYEWNFGAAIGWKPYSQQNKYLNFCVGSQVNAYLNLSFYLNYSLNKNTEIFGGLSVSHFSNGNTSFPNPGVNAFGLRVGLTYTLNPQDQDYEPVLPDTIKKKKLHYDISLWGASRKRLFRGIDPPVMLPGHYACAGVSFSPMVALNTWWRVGGSVDLQWDQSSDKKRTYISGTITENLRFSSPNFFRQLSFGISAHGELQMPIFAVNVGIGYNFISPWENRGTYQNITLKTYLCSNLYLNVGYQLRNFQQQSSLMLGLGLSL